MLFLIFFFFNKSQLKENIISVCVYVSSKLRDAEKGGELCLIQAASHPTNPPRSSQVLAQAG